VAKEIFDKFMPTPNQVGKKRDDVNVTARDLLDFRPEQPITEAGLRMNINVSLQYLGSWLAGTGCVPIFNLMEDAATAEISRSQIWQWIRSPKGVLEDGRKVTVELFRQLLPDELAKVRKQLGDHQFVLGGRYDMAAKLLDDIVTREDYFDFITLPAYDQID
jgi:malate synthase